MLCSVAVTFPRNLPARDGSAAPSQLPFSTDILFLSNFFFSSVSFSPYFSTRPRDLASTKASLQQSPGRAPQPSPVPAQPSPLHLRSPFSSCGDVDFLLVIGSLRSLIHWSVPWHLGGIWAVFSRQCGSVGVWECGSVGAQPVGFCWRVVRWAGMNWSVVLVHFGGGLGGIFRGSGRHRACKILASHLCCLPPAPASTYPISHPPSCRAPCSSRPRLLSFVVAFSAASPGVVSLEGTTRGTAAINKSVVCTARLVFFVLFRVPLGS